MRSVSVRFVSEVLTQTLVTKGNPIHTAKRGTPSYYITIFCHMIRWSRQNGSYTGSLILPTYGLRRAGATL